MIRKTLPTFAGAGQVRFAGHEGPAHYTIEGDPARLRQGAGRLQGSFTTSAELAKQAFQAGEGVLTLESGVRLRMVMVAHTDGGCDVFIELRI